jgi:zinc-binding alcohol dehydrogenase/oxidoreductase
MRILSLTSITGMDGVSLADAPIPNPAAGEVRVALKASALNHRELFILQGQYPGMVLPTTLGADGAGTIDAVGEGVDAVFIGKDVVLYPAFNWGDDPALYAPDFGLLGMPGPGTIGEAICVPADLIADKPAHLDFAQAAAVPLAALTAWRGLTTKGAIKAGDRLLVTGAGGGVATFAILLGLAMGADVYVTSGSDETIAKAVALGAKAGFNYKSEGWNKALAKASGGIDLVLDGAPAGGYAGYGRALALGARVVIYGSTGGIGFPVNAPELFLKNVTIKGTNMGNPQEFREMIAFVSAQKLMPVIDRIFPLAEAKEALAYLQDGHSFGKVVITI